MTVAKQFGLVVTILAMLLPVRAALASQGGYTSEKAKKDAEKSLKKDAEKSVKNDKEKYDSEKDGKVKKEKDKNSVYSVPEPTTIILLGAAAGALGARKLWQARRSGSV